MLLKKDVERCKRLAYGLKTEYKKQGDIEREYYYLGVMHSCDSILGRKYETYYVDNMEMELEQLKEENKNV